LVAAIGLFPVQIVYPPGASLVRFTRLLQSPAISPMSDHFVVCGLGSLGQHCVATLKEFGVVVSGIDLIEPTDWEITNLPALLSPFVRGDCRQPQTLEQAGVCQCRAVLLVSSDERVNIEAAFAVRLLTSTARIIVRSSKQNLNQLVNSHLGDFVAFEATQLSAPAFAIAALGSEMRGFINLAGSLLQVKKVQITRNHPWCDRRTLQDLNSSNRRVLSHIPAQAALPTEFHTWQPDQQVQAGDLVAYVEITEGVAAPGKSAANQQKAKLTPRGMLRQVRDRLSRNGLKQTLISFWHSTAEQQSKRVLLVVGAVVLTVFLIGLMILKLAYPQHTWLMLLYTVGVMLLGAYDTVFGVFDPASSIPIWLRFMNLGYMMVGTASIAVLYALLTERLLAAKFQLPKKRPELPTQDHVVLIGLGRVGQRVATFLQQMKQPIVGVSTQSLDASILPQMPLVVGDLTSALTKVNLETARSVVVVTDDEMANLEIGLMAHEANPACAIAMRVFNPQFGESISQLVPFAKVLSAYALSAEAFVVTAFGENVLGLIRLNEQTVLVTEYQIVAGDTLHNLILSEVAYGYGVVPILHQRERDLPRLMPSEDMQLRAGDRLVLLATIDGLQQIERGDRILPNCWVQVEQALAKDAIFDGERVITRVVGCTINEANQLMKQLPQRLAIPLYRHQAQRLVRELRKAQVIANVVPTGS
jgi:Trk K+ transport system NAD-binding subunit